MNENIKNGYYGIVIYNAYESIDGENDKLYFCQFNLKLGFNNLIPLICNYYINCISINLKDSYFQLFLRILSTFNICFDKLNSKFIGYKNELKVPELKYKLSNDKNIKIFEYDEKNLNENEDDNEKFKNIFRNNKCENPDGVCVL